MSTTVGDLIKNSLRLIGAIATGETPSAAEQSDAFNSLNEMLDSWSTENLIIYNKVEDDLALVAGQQSYTMGTGGNFNTARALKIENAYLRTVSGSNNLDLPIEILNQDQWANISLKTTQSSIPTKLFQQGTYPLDTILLWPTPNDASKILVLWSWKPLSNYAATTDVVSLPPGYLRALRYNLALELCAEYGINPLPGIAAAALESKENIKRMNIKDTLMSCDPSVVGPRSSFNWLIGE